MENREFIIRALSQMLAPRLFVLSGDKPSEMGFPFADTEDEVNERIERQFNPINYWSEKAQEIAEAIVDTLEAGGNLSGFDIDKIVRRSAVWAEKWQPCQ